MEDGRERGSMGSKAGGPEEMVTQLRDCKRAAARRNGWSEASTPWLVLSDDVPFLLEVGREGAAVTTITDAAFTLDNGLHVGKLGSGAKREHAYKSWLMALKDWFLVVEAPGLVLLGNTMASAGSFGKRAAFLGGKACKRSDLECGAGIFQNMCSNVAM